MGNEVPTTLVNEKNTDSTPLMGLPWQWQTVINLKKHIRCIVVGNKIWTYSLSESQLNGRSLREANESDDAFVWREDKLPSMVQNNLLCLLAEIGLRYSAPEFLVDKNNNYIFIDLNPCGDWLGFSNEKDGQKIAREIVAKL